MKTPRLQFGTMLFALAAPVTLSAQQEGDPDHEWCDQRWGDWGEEQYCEVREFTMDARDRVRVDAGPNGGITVEGWDRNEIRILARVRAWSRRDDPLELVREIEVVTDGSIIYADGPRSRYRGRSRSGWSVSFDLMVPRNSDLDLESLNGGISIVSVDGRMDFETTNGGIHLEDLRGDVEGTTTNGGVKLILDGAEWQGSGVDVRTTNGGVVIEIPEGYRADLEVGTTNGGFDFDFPITVQGRFSRRRINTELNGGGNPIRVITTNGGVRLRER